LGSEPSCGGAERNPVSGSPERRLPMFRQGWFASAAKVNYPPISSNAAGASFDSFGCNQPLGVLDKVIHRSNLDPGPGIKGEARRVSGGPFGRAGAWVR
jgi:hypothetical protein